MHAVSEVLGLERRLQGSSTGGREPLLQSCRAAIIRQAAAGELQEGGGGGGGGGIGAKHAAVLESLRSLPGLSGYVITAEVRPFDSSHPL